MVSETVVSETVVSEMVVSEINSNKNPMWIFAEATQKSPSYVKETLFRQQYSTYVNIKK